MCVCVCVCVYVCVEIVCVYVCVCACVCMCVYVCDWEQWVTTSDMWAQCYKNVGPGLCKRTPVAQEVRSVRKFEKCTRVSLVDRNLAVNHKATALRMHRAQQHLNSVSVLAHCSRMQSSLYCVKVQRVTQPV